MMKILLQRDPEGKSLHPCYGFVMVLETGRLLRSCYSHLGRVKDKEQRGLEE